MSIPRLLGIIALVLFVIFVATFLTVFVRLTRVGVVTERYALIETEDAEASELTLTRFDFVGQDPETGQLTFRVAARIHTEAAPFNSLYEGDTLVLRVENMVPELRRNMDLAVRYGNPTGDRMVNLDFGELRMDILDRRDFYPFDGYDFSFNCAYHVPGDWQHPQGYWFQPKKVEIRSLTNMIILNPRYGSLPSGERAFKMRMARLRIQQYLTATLILIEVLFLLYLLTIVNLQDLLTKGLGYLIGLYIIRDILVTDAPQFPSIIDYGTLFLICVFFFLLLFRFLGGAEEHALITLPTAWRDALLGQKESDEVLMEGDEEDEEPFGDESGPDV